MSYLDIPKKVIGLWTAAVLSAAGCAQQPEQPPATEPGGPQITRAVAVIHPTEGHEVRGTVTFTREAGGVRIVADLRGLPAGEHGFHIHEFGDCSAPDGTSAGGHYNPQGKPHGAPDAAERHAGDLGNITADDTGHATYDRVDTVIRLNGPDSILGRSIIIHAGADDLVSQPTGAAGARLGCAVIGAGA